jgi:hypothetical protein
MPILPSKTDRLYNKAMRQSSRAKSISKTNPEKAAVVAQKAINTIDKRAKVINSRNATDMSAPKTTSTAKRIVGKVFGNSKVSTMQSKPASIPTKSVKDITVTPLKAKVVTTKKVKGKVVTTLKDRKYTKAEIKKTSKK